MANLAKVLKDEIARISRREGRSLTRKLRDHSAQYRRDLAALKRENETLRRKVAFLESVERKRTPAAAKLAAAENGADLRFQARGLRSHRAKIGLSAADYGTLVGVSGQSIYSWEQEKSKPRKRQIASLAAVREMGKREALKRLEVLAAAK